jgi:hypothetical protein
VFGDLVVTTLIPFGVVTIGFAPDCHDDQAQAVEKQKNLSSAGSPILSARCDTDQVLGASRKTREIMKGVNSDGAGDEE